MGFHRDRNNPLDQELLIIDETSMIDTILMDSFLEAVPSASRLIFVGDVDQLPSVGAGALLLDLIESEIIPVVLPLLFIAIKTPAFFLLNTFKACLIFEFSLINGISFPVYINSPTVFSFAPKLPLGWNFLKSSLENNYEQPFDRYLVDLKGDFFNLKIVA